MGAVSQLVDRQLTDVVAAAAAGDEVRFPQDHRGAPRGHAPVCLAFSGDPSSGDPSLAEDAVQAAWLVAWKKLDRVTSPEQLRPWLVSVAVNEARHLLRCDGLIRFDGVTADHFLPGRCTTMGIATDGSVWALAEGGAGKDLHVITTEAVATSGR